MNVQTFVAEAFEQELAMFRAVLEIVPEPAFSTSHLRHSPAWHALHIAEWLRFFALQDFSPSYAHLGWEDAPWMPALRGTPPVTETDGKAAVLAELDRVGTLIVTHVRTLRDDQWQDKLRSPAAPTGERARLSGLGMHLRHIAYHQGQLKLSLKEGV